MTLATSPTRPDLNNIVKNLFFNYISVHILISLTPLRKSLVTHIYWTVIKRSFEDNLNPSCLQNNQMYHYTKSPQARPSC